jgi:hypothetical protein
MLRQDTEPATRMGSCDCRIVRFRVRGELTRPVRDARRFPSPRLSPVPKGYTYAAKDWDLSLVQGPISVAPFHRNLIRFATLRCISRWGFKGRFERGLKSMMVWYMEKSSR